MSISIITDKIRELQSQIEALPDVKQDLNLQEKIVTPSAEVQVITADPGYDALSSVTVEAINYNNIERFTLQVYKDDGFVSQGGYWISFIPGMTWRQLCESNLCPMTPNSYMPYFSINDAGYIAITGGTEIMTYHLDIGVIIDYVRPDDLIDNTQFEYWVQPT